MEVWRFRVNCNFYSILFCVWFKLAVLAVLADCLYPQLFVRRVRVFVAVHGGSRD